ncbi:hypothetical protein GCM10027348_25120 [Hymenobacter tenuis]
MQAGRLDQGEVPHPQRGKLRQPYFTKPGLLIDTHRGHVRCIREPPGNAVFLAASDQLCKSFLKSDKRNRATPLPAQQVPNRFYLNQ